MPGLKSAFMLAILCCLLPACSGKRIVATHRAADGAELEIVEVTDSEPFRLFALQVKSPAGEMVKNVALEVPFSYDRGFKFVDKDGEVVIEKDGEGDLRYLASYWLSDSDPKKPHASCPRCVPPPSR